MYILYVFKPTLLHFETVYKQTIYVMLSFLHYIQVYSIDDDDDWFCLVLFYPPPFPQ